MFHNYRYQIKAEKLLEWLRGIETITGGRGDWRCPVFRGVECEGWLKYIRCYRNPKDTDYFIVCNGSSNPIMWELCTEDRLEKEYLNFIED